MNSQGCIFLDTGINFEVDMVSDCCISHNEGRGLPILIEKYQGEMIDWEKLFEIKEKRIAAQKKTTIYECEGCYRLCDYSFSGERKISNFHFSHSRVCNSRCIYCSGIYNFGSLNYNTYPVIKDLIDKGYYISGGEATMQGGEPTLMQDFEKLVDLLIDSGTKIRIHTNSIKYSPAIAFSLNKKMCTMVTSLDCGCASTYKKIKRVDAYNSVVENIKKYVQASCDNVIIKYIIIPVINDNTAEIDKFFNLMKELNVKNVAVDIEVQYARKYENNFISPHIYMLYDYFEYNSELLNMELSTYSFMLYVLRNRKLKKTKFPTNKFFFDLVLNIYNKRNKNLKYR